MARPIWKGQITFGLVNIPIGLYPAEKRAEFNFDLVDKRDLSPIGYRKVNKTTGEEVPKTEISKGFKTEEGRYVLVTDEDLERVEPEKSKSVEVLSFVSLSEIRPISFDAPYYLEPLPPGRKGYVLLREALLRTGRVAVARVVLRTKERLAAVVPEGPVLVLNMMRWAHELRETRGLDIPPQKPSEVGVTDKEIALAEKLIEDMVEPWQPEKFRDEHHEALMTFLREKAESGGRAPRAAQAAGRKKAPGGDLMTLLKRSISEAETGKARRTPRSAG